MTTYIQFEPEGEDDFPILIEVDENELEYDLGGTSKVGLKEVIDNTIAIAHKTFTSAVKSAIKHNVQGLLEGIQALPNPPSEIEISFGLKATSELSNMAVGKIGGETNYAIKLVWKNSNE